MYVRLTGYTSIVYYGCNISVEHSSAGSTAGGHIAIHGCRLLDD